MSDQPERRQLRVFMSWSGATSQSLAAVFQEWLLLLLDRIKPYFSPVNIVKGSRWGNDISTELEAARIGLIFLTRDNLMAPWVIFEAGALAKNIDEAKICPILFDVDPADLSDPLKHFQASRFSKAEIRNLVTMLYSELKGKKPTVIFYRKFEAIWPQLENEVSEVLERVTPVGSGLGQSQLIEETHRLVQILTDSDSARIRYAPRHMLAELASRFQELVEDAKHLSSFGEIYHPLLELGDAITVVLALHLPAGDVPAAVELST